MGAMARSSTHTMVEVVGSSPEGVDAAIASALEQAGRLLRTVSSFEVLQIRGVVTDWKTPVTEVSLSVIGRMRESDEPSRQ